MNHGPRFWALVESHEPNARALDAALGEAWREVPGWSL
jgi:predicted metal-dependent hydrolase